MRRALPQGFGNGRNFAVIIVAVVVLGWLLSGLYRVDTDEQGVELRFGRWVDTTGPGLHYHLPSPIETVLTPKVTRVNRVEIGYRTGTDPRTRGIGSRDVGTESRMLTGDENIVELAFAVTWRIKDAGQYLFNIRDPEATVRVAAESAMRDVIGQSPIQNALNVGQEQIADRARILLQQLLDGYKSGIEIVQVQLQRIEPPSVVVDAFNDVQRAKADQERVRNEAEAYRNDIIPRARGDAERLIQEAEAYKEQVSALAQGDAKRFLSVLEAYKGAQDVTALRLYLETMEDILKGANKIIIDPHAQGGQGVVPYLPLPALQNMQQPAQPPAPPPPPQRTQSQGGGR
jgi:membrane protease subunit HflK